MSYCLRAKVAASPPIANTPILLVGAYTNHCGGHKVQIGFRFGRSSKSGVRLFVENATLIELGNERYPVRRTSRHRLCQVDFLFDGNKIRGLEQNPQTKSEWARLARSGKKVMQFLSEAVPVSGIRATLRICTTPLRCFQKIFFSAC